MMQDVASFIATLALSNVVLDEETPIKINDLNEILEEASKGKDDKAKINIKNRLFKEKYDDILAQAEGIKTKRIGLLQILIESVY